MTKTSPATEPFFSHDISTRTNKSIKKLINSLGYEGYGLFWAIVEFMHKNELMVGEENLVVDDNYTEKITHILNDYDFFRIENGCYISDRILRNIDKQEQKNKQNKTKQQPKHAGFFQLSQKNTMLYLDKLQSLNRKKSKNSNLIIKEYRTSKNCCRISC